VLVWVHYRYPAGRSHLPAAFVKRDDHPEFNFDDDDEPKKPKKPEKPKPTGEELRDEGIERVVGNTPESYREAFNKTAEEDPELPEWFTSEDITRRCGMPPNHPHAVGGLISGLIKREVIEPVNDDAKSKVPSSHAARLRLYRRKSR
jgi:hypothetical protein